MNGFLRRYRTGLIFFGYVELAISSLLLCLTILLITLQVFLRTDLISQSAFGIALGLRPLSWMEEAVTYGLIWITFLGAAFCAKQLRHVTISAIPSRLSGTAQYIVRIVTDSVMFVVLIFLIHYVRIVIPIEGLSTSTALPIELPRSLFFSIALFSAVLLMVLTNIYYFIVDIYVLCNRSKKIEIAESELITSGEAREKIRGGIVRIPFPLWVDDLELDETEGGVTPNAESEGVS